MVSITTFWKWQTGQISSKHVLVVLPYSVDYKMYWSKLLFAWKLQWQDDFTLHDLIWFTQWITQWITTWFTLWIQPEIQPWIIPWITPWTVPEVSKAETWKLRLRLRLFICWSQLWDWDWYFSSPVSKLDTETETFKDWSHILRLRLNFRGSGLKGWDWDLV